MSDDGFRWFPYLGHKRIDANEALEVYDLELLPTQYLSALVFEWLYGALILVAKVKETK